MNSVPSNLKRNTRSPETDFSMQGEAASFLSETAEDPEVSPEELVLEAKGSYCRKVKGGRHE